MWALSPLIPMPPPLISSHEYNSNAKRSDRSVYEILNTKQPNQTTAMRLSRIDINGKRVCETSKYQNSRHKFTTNILLSKNKNKLKDEKVSPPRWPFPYPELPQPVVENSLSVSAVDVAVACGRQSSFYYVDVRI